MTVVVVVTTTTTTRAADPRARCLDRSRPHHNCRSWLSLDRYSRPAPLLLLLSSSSPSPSLLPHLKPSTRLLKLERPLVGRGEEWSELRDPETLVSQPANKCLFCPLARPSCSGLPPGHLLLGQPPDCYCFGGRPGPRALASGRRRRLRRRRMRTRAAAMRADPWRHLTVAPSDGHLLALGRPRGTMYLSPASRSCPPVSRPPTCRPARPPDESRPSALALGVINCSLAAERKLQRRVNRWLLSAHCLGGRLEQTRRRLPASSRLFIVLASAESELIPRASDSLHIFTKIPRPRPISSPGRPADNLLPVCVMFSPLQLRPRLKSGRPTTGGRSARVVRRVDVLSDSTTAPDKPSGCEFKSPPGPADSIAQQVDLKASPTCLSPSNKLRTAATCSPALQKSSSPSSASRRR